MVIKTNKIGMANSFIQCVLLKIFIFFGIVVFGQNREIRIAQLKPCGSNLHITLSSFLDENRSGYFLNEQKECYVVLSFNSDEDSLEVFYKKLQEDWRDVKLDIPVTIIVRPYVGFKTVVSDQILVKDSSKVQTSLQLGHLNMMLLCQDQMLRGEVIARLSLSKKENLYDFEHFSNESDSNDVVVFKKIIQGACLIDEKKTVLNYLAFLRDNKSQTDYKIRVLTDGINNLQEAIKRDSLSILEKKNEINNLNKIIYDRKLGVESYSFHGDISFYSSKLSFLGQDVKCRGYSSGISIGKRSRNEGSKSSFEFGGGFGNRTLHIEQNENYQESVSGSNYSDILRVKGFNEELNGKYINGFLQWKYQLNSSDVPISYSASIGYQLGINYNYVVKSNSYEISNSRLYNQFPTEITSLAGQNLYSASYSYINQLSGASRLYHCVLFGAEAIWYMPKNNDFAVTAQGQFGFPLKKHTNEIGSDYVVNASNDQSSIILTTSNWMPKQFAINLGLIYILR